MRLRLARRVRAMPTRMQAAPSSFARWIGSSSTTHAIARPARGTMLENADVRAAPSRCTAVYQMRYARLIASRAEHTIVVVDDEPAVLETLRLSLRHLAKVNAVGVQDPRQALAAIEGALADVRAAGFVG